MPKKKIVWSSWNSILDKSDSKLNCVTYWLNKLQNLNADKNLNTGIPAMPTQDDADQSAYPGAVYNESALEDGVSYTVMISGHGVEDIVGPQFVFSRGGGGGVPMSTIRTFMRTPSYTIVKTDSLG